MKLTDPPTHQKWAIYASHLTNPDGSFYMRRWIFRTPWGTLRVHNICSSDSGRDFHDHPFSFTSLILRGGYLEHVPGCRCGNKAPYQLWEGNHAPGTPPCRYYGPGSVVRRKATDLHRLDLTNGSAWTFVLGGPYERKWGFKTPNGWVYHRDYKVQMK